MSTSWSVTIHRRLGRLHCAIAACTFAVLVAISAPAVAGATFGIEPGSLAADAYNQDATLATQAGSHPFVGKAAFDFNLKPGVDVETLDERVKTIQFDLPAGFVGNPRATDTCAQAVFGALADPTVFCPMTSQVGILNLKFGLPANTGPFSQVPLAVFNLEPPTGYAAAFGVNFAGVPIVFLAKTRAGDNGIRVIARNVPEGVSIRGQELALWGVPADVAHDGERYCTDGSSLSFCSYSLPTPRRPFLRNPTSCDGPQPVGVTVDSWQQPGDFKPATVFTQAGVQGCDELSFAPSTDVSVDSRTADSPAGLTADLKFPQEGLQDPDGLAAPDLRTATVQLPEGLTINPGAAGGLEACSDEQLAATTDAPVQCPAASKVGTVTATTPLLADPVMGDVYIGSQNSSDPASGDMFRMFLNLVSDERGVNVKLVGRVKADPVTGRLEATFDDNPQLPVSEISLKLKSGPRAPLATPSTCGDKAVGGRLTSWAGSSAEVRSGFVTDCAAGLGGFAPAFAAGAANAVGGAFSPFGLSVTKPDGDAALNGLSLTLPSGLLARVKGNLGTQVGSVKAYAGPGTNPFVLPGQVFLEGPYGDAPFSLKVVVPAKAGPFDLGEVVVRQRIYVDPITAQVTVVSDPVPTIVKGVPVRLQRLDVSVDKPGFMLNPTSCGAKAVGGTLSAVGGQTAPVNVRFQVGDCGSLALKPSLALWLSGKGQTVDGKHPAVTAELTQPFGAQANLKKVRVALPLSLALDPDNANGLCEFVDGSKVEPTCPRASIVGTATAVTPILDQPLSGPVYFVKNIRRDAKSGREIRTLPKLVIPLVGQNGVKLTLTGTSAVENDQLVTTFDNLPDAPVSSFKLGIIGGKGGILVVSGTDICKATQIADQQINGQNGKQADTDVYIQTPSCPLKVISKTVGTTSVAVKVGGLGAGKVTLTGRGIKKTTKTITKSTVATITAKRTKSRPGKVTVSYDPTGPAKARKTTK